ncbi:MAG: beta-ketoacyl synthase N-terminal-like domain-containing protein [Planctomycetota bacterium]|nr:beta-ketoacyl synthase N-terminal-like domain-containing protein [Planctomycetota bacterium]
MTTPQQLDERLKSMTPLQRAVFALKETQARLETLQRQRTEPIAIVGMACRFPGGADDPLSFLRMLRAGVDAIRETPADRWDAEALYDPNPAAPGKMNTRWGGFLDRIDEFDNHFFGISDHEAARIDPQQRMLLELSWEALEDAGLPPATLRGTKIGVFIGISLSDYGMLLASDLSQTDAHAASGTSLCLAANRVSFAFGLQGPSLALDTACSSSLVAIHLACQHIRNGECSGALAGGCSLLLSPVGTLNLTKAGLSASDGRVRAFDAAASGYVRGEGVGVVMLKPLSAALQNQDPIYAVIRGSAVNQNGISNGLMAPSRAAQEQVLREAYTRAGVSPSQVQYVETQGTGTRLGDTLEALALGHVLGAGRAPDSRCAIGSVKTNIGHLEASSGVASLIKVALSLKHRQLLPSLHFQTPNPDIPFDQLSLRVQQQLEPWPNSTQPRLAGVSAFGFGGSNSHAVLEEAPVSVPDSAADDSQPRSYLLPLSARNERALRDLVHRYGEFLRTEPTRWCDVCYTAAVRRDHHDCRLAVLADSPAQAAQLLGDWRAGEVSPLISSPVSTPPQQEADAPRSPLLEQDVDAQHAARHQPRRLFTGRKPFGRNLKVAFVYGGRAENWIPYLTHVTAAVPGLANALEEIDAALTRVVGWPLAPLLKADSRWVDAAFWRPALLALQLALTAWWRRTGVTPDVVLGQGVGELAAACAAGILTADEALRVVTAEPRGVGVQPLPGLRPRPATLPFLSAVDGREHSGPDLDAAHWRSCLGGATDAAAAVGTLSQRHVDVYLEVGPATLTESIAGRLTQTNHPGVVVPSLRLADGGGGEVLTAVGTLYAAGADLSWPALAPADGRCVRVPTYPWQRQQLWTPIKGWAAASSAAQTRPGEPAVTGAGSQGVPSGPQSTTERNATEAFRSRPDLTTPYVAPRTKLETDIVQSWSILLRLDRIGVHDNFFELGGDSLQATILHNRLQEHLGEAVPGHLLFQVQTVADLAAHLQSHCSETVLRRYPAEDSIGQSAASDHVPAPGSSNRRQNSGDGMAVASTPAIPRLARDDQAEQLLAQLDALSDEEVQRLLGQTMAEDTVSHE